MYNYFKFFWKAALQCSGQTVILLMSVLHELMSGSSFKINMKELYTHKEHIHSQTNNK